MPRTFRFVLLLVLGTLVTATLAPAAFAQQYPTKPIQMIIPWQAGDATDLISRTLCDIAGKALGQPFVVLNKPGGGTSIGVAAVKSERPDGYTLGYITGSSIMMQYLRDVPYDVNADFTPLIRFIEFSTMGVVVRAEAPWKSMKELVEYAKANPGKVKYTTSGIGSPHHIAMETLAKNAGIKWVNVPSKSGSDAITAVLGGHVDATATSSQWKPQLQAGKLRLLATYGKKRSSVFPDTPTFIELGYNASGFAFGGFIGPKGLPQPIVDRLHAAFKDAMNDPQFKQVVQKFDIDPSYNTPEGLAKDIKELHELYGKFAAEAGLKKGQ
jgi:tripartite-type tricarboxylate transporter receptor subunit TctC